MCAQESLRARDRQPWTVHEAAYVALGGAKRTLVPRWSSRRGDAKREKRSTRPARGCTTVLDGIARGEFPRGRTRSAGAATAPTRRSAARTTSTMSSAAPRLPFDEGDDSLESRIDARDRAARERAVDPRFNVALEASAGTGKTRVLVDRYLNLLKAGVDPSHILA
jgi:hypothetical protein